MMSSCIISLFNSLIRVTHICVSKLTIIGSDNGLSPDRRQAIIWTNAGILLIGPLGTNFSENLIEIHAFVFKKMHLKMSSAICRPSCLGLNVLKLESWTQIWLFIEMMPVVNMNLYSLWNNWEISSDSLTRATFLVSYYRNMNMNRNRIPISIPAVKWWSPGWHAHQLIEAEWRIYASVI